MTLPTITITMLVTFYFASLSIGYNSLGFVFTAIAIMGLALFNAVNSALSRVAGDADPVPNQLGDK
jgi:branched-subunit amino acid transport protein AzlD